MRYLELNHRRTTTLGFGGSLLGSTSQKEACRLLAAAFDAGIRHFDVAPMYGAGNAEALLRKALGPKVREVTIATKYGLKPPSETIGRRLARKLLQPFPALKSHFRQRAAPPTDSPMEDPLLPPLTAMDAQRSIDSSLKNLGVDTIDLLLLHEATPGRLCDPRLLETLEQYKAAGKIRAFGIGSRSARVLACQQQRPEYCCFLQYEWSVLAPSPAALRQRPYIVHGSFGSGAKPTDAQLGRWSQALDLDLHQPGRLAQLLLKASLLHNAGHIVLFSTRTVANIQSNVRTAEDAGLEASARAFQALVQSEAM